MRDPNEPPLDEAPIAPVNLLLMVNGSPDRSGAQRRYGETVPADITSAMEAAAWQYGVHPDAYAQLVRRT